MARFKLTAAHVAPGTIRLGIGATIADSVANAQAGDVVWPGLNSSSISDAMTPLDAAGTAMKSGSSFSNKTRTASSGCDS